MRCFFCKKEIKGNGLLISEDGDFVCSEDCKLKYEEERDYFLNNVVASEERLLEYILKP